MMLDEIAGHSEVKAVIAELLASERMPRSVIFAGDYGIGKRQVALAVAAASACKEPKNSLACGSCSACERVKKIEIPDGEKKDEFERMVMTWHPDVGFVLPYKRRILVDAIRHLEREANFRPFEARARTFIVDDADKMNDSAANALLKTLEEPAETTNLILLTSRPESLLPTIRSRCQTIRFGPLSVDIIERFLIDKMAFGEDAARLAARLGRGSIGRAAAIDVGSFRASRERLVSIISAAKVDDLGELLFISETLNDAKNKDEFEPNLDILESIIHDIWTITVGGTIERLTNQDIADDIGGLASDLDPDRLTTWLADLAELKRELAVNINRRVATDSLFVKMASVR